METVDDKVEELNTMFPEESSGTIYAGRNKNTWVVYNPLKTVRTLREASPCSTTLPRTWI